MRLRLTDPALVADLLGVLSVRADFVVKRVNEHELEAGVLGSYADAGAVELTLMVRAWQVAHPDVGVELS